MRLRSALVCTLGCIGVRVPAASAQAEYALGGGPLAQHALQKVLHDASEIFGSSPSDSGNRTSSRSTWMSAYSDDTPLISMTIPGTHDAATWNYSQARQDTLRPVADLLNVTLQDARVYRCQRSSVAAALEAGIRFFDLRYALDPTGARLVFWHHEALMSEVSGVEEVLFAFWNWLDTYPSEAVFLSFQYEGATHAGASNSATVQRMFFDVLTSPASKRHFLQEHALGSLGPARGKAVLVRRFVLDLLPPEYEDELPGIRLSPDSWTDNSPDIRLVYDGTTKATAYIEDYYEPSVPPSANVSANVAAKLGAVVAHLDMAASDQFADSLFITFTSGEHLGAEVPVYPETLALGNGTSVTPDGGANHQMLSLLAGYKGKRKGIVVLDFWDEPGGLIDGLLAL